MCDLVKGQSIILFLVLFLANLIYEDHLPKIRESLKFFDQQGGFESLMKITK